MADTRFEIVDNKSARLITTDFLLRNIVAKGLTVQLPNYQFTKAYKKNGWDGTISLFKKTNNTMPAGLLGLATEKAKGRGLDIPIVDLRKFSRIKIPDYSFIEKCLNGKIMRDYQVAAIIAILKETRGIIQSPTGSGKTMIAAGAAKLANIQGLKVLFIVHQIELLYQTKKAFLKAGIDCGMVGDSKRDIDHPTIVGTVQTLYSGINKYDKDGILIKKADPELAALLKGIDFIVLDEAHRVDSKMFQAVCDAAENAAYRIGLTATPLMKGVMEDMSLMGQTGNIIYRITIKDLVDRGLLAQPYIKLVKIYEPKIARKLKYSTAYKLGVTDNNLRNIEVVNHALDFARHKMTTLILVNQINHGQTLLSMLKDYPGLKVQFIHGSKSTETRDQALEDLAEKRIDILISSVIADEGVDIPAVSAVILAGGLKSPIKVYQRIGRGMRPKDEGNWVLIVDFIDLTNHHLARHSKERFSIIHDEPGFEIVPNFDFLMKKAA